MLKSETKERARVIDDETVSKGRGKSKRRKRAKYALGVPKHGPERFNRPIPGRSAGGRPEDYQKLVKNMTVGGSILFYTLMGVEKQRLYVAATQIKAQVKFRYKKKGKVKTKSCVMWRVR